MPRQFSAAAAPHHFRHFPAQRDIAENEKAVSPHDSGEDLGFPISENAVNQGHVVFRVFKTQLRLVMPICIRRERGLAGKISGAQLQCSDVQCSQ